MWYLLFQLDVGCDCSPGLRSAQEPEEQGHPRRPHNWTSVTIPAVNTHLPGSPGLSHSDHRAGDPEPRRSDGKDPTPPLLPAFGLSGLRVPQTRRMCGGWLRITPLN